MKTYSNYITLITTNAKGFPLLIKHKAILFEGENGQPYIIHRTTSGVEIITLQEFMKERHIINHKRYPIRREFHAQTILAKYNQEPFDWMSNNCEDFTSRVIEDVACTPMRPHSPQRTAWIIVLAIILITMILIKK